MKLTKMSSTKKINYSNPFDLEKLREFYIVNKKYSKFRDTYNSGFPEIPNVNTSYLWNSLNESFKSNPMETDRIKKVATYIKGNELKVLNIGPGSGNLEQEYFMKNNFKDKSLWTSLDISPKTLEKLKNKYPFINTQLGNITEINLKNMIFDYIIALEVFEHIPPSKILSVLENIKKMLNKNGQLIISVPLNEGLEEMVNKGLNPNAHLRCYTKNILIGELLISGFDIVRDEELYAFNKLYKVKTIISKSLIKYKQSNNLIVIAKKR